MKVKNIVLAAVLSVGACSMLHAQNGMMPSSMEMPDMSQMGKMMEESMVMARFFSAPIEDRSALKKSDVEHFISMIEEGKDGKQRYNAVGKKLEEGYKKAAKVLQPGVSFDTFVEKAIVLSGAKDQLDGDARKLGYKDAKDMTIKTHRIIRAYTKAKMDKEMADMPPQQRAMMQSMTSGMMGGSSAEDMAVVAPYMDKLDKVISEE